MAPPGCRRRRRSLVAGVGAFLLLGIAGCGADPPDDDVRDATRRFLEGDGARLLLMHRTALDQVQDGTTAETCRVRAGALQAELDGQEALALVAQVPDAGLQEALAEERVALGRSLTACAAARPSPPAAELAAATTLVDERLDGLGAGR